MPSLFRKWPLKRISEYHILQYILSKLPRTSQKSVAPPKARDWWMDLFGVSTEPMGPVGNEGVTVTHRHIMPHVSSGLCRFFVTWREANNASTLGAKDSGDDQTSLRLFTATGRAAKERLKLHATNGARKLRTGLLALLLGARTLLRTKGIAARSKISFQKNGVGGEPRARLPQSGR